MSAGEQLPKPSSSIILLPSPSPGSSSLLRLADPQDGGCVLVRKPGGY
jgi:hypothetical protein